MRITQGTFSFLPDLTDAQIALQIDYCLDKGWASASNTPTTRIRATPTGRCSATRCSTCATRPASCSNSTAAARPSRTTTSALTAFDSTHGTESVVMSLHRQPARRRAGLPPGAQEGAGPHDALQHRELRGAGAARRRDATERRQSAMNDARTAAAPPRRTRCSRPRASARRARPTRPRAGRPGAGEGPHPRHRRAAADRQAARRAGPAPRAAVAAHVLHRQPRHRQDHRGAAHGASPATARLCAQGPPGRGDARRPGRPVHRPHRAEDARGR